MKYLQLKHTYVCCGEGFFLIFEYNHCKSKRPVLWLCQHHGQKKEQSSKTVLDEQPLAFYTHCCGHSLSLAISDMMKNSSTMKKALDITHEVTKLIKYSPRKEVPFLCTKDDIAPGTPGICGLCLTCWTVRAETMDKIDVIRNYSAPQEVREKATEIIHDSDTIAHIRRLESMMQTFDFFFSAWL